MSLFALLAVAVAAPPPPSPEVAQEIRVIGKKLKTWKGGVSKIGGRMICKTTKSSGDKAIDAIRCGAMLTCTKPLEPRIDALMASDRTRKDKLNGFNALLQSAVPCLEAEEARGAERLAAQRANA